MTSLSPSYHGYRFLSEIISQAVWLYRQTSEETHGVEGQMRGAIRPAAPEPKPDAAAPVEAQPILRNRGTLRMPTEAFETVPLTGSYPELRIELRGNLAALLRAATNAERPSDTEGLHLQVKLVAGAGFEPATFGL